MSAASPKGTCVCPVHWIDQFIPRIERRGEERRREERRREEKRREEKRREEKRREGEDQNSGMSKT